MELLRGIDLLRLRCDVFSYNALLARKENWSQGLHLLHRWALKASLELTRMATEALEADLISPLKAL